MAKPAYRGRPSWNIGRCCPPFRIGRAEHNKAYGQIGVSQVQVTSGSETRGWRNARLTLATGLGVMSVLHLVARPTFEAMIPKWLPGDPAAWNYAATAAEFGSAALLARKSTARAGGMLAFVTFAVVWVANLQHVAQGGVYPDKAGLLGNPVVAWIRAPLQLPLLWMSWRIARPREDTRV